MARRVRHTFVFGLGATGVSCLRYLYGRDRLTVVDTRQRPANLDEARHRYTDVAFICGDLEPNVFDDADRIIVSPGLPLDHPSLDRARTRGVPCIGDIDLFCEAAAAIPVIAITGTNGKSTATALAGELVVAAGVDVGVGGNLGVPALDLLAPTRQAYVVELSSFQLERLDAGRFQVASLMNVTPDHLDRYRDVDEYAAAKQRIYRNVPVAVFNRDDSYTTPPKSVPNAVSVGLDAPSAGHWGIAEEGGARSLVYGRSAVIAATELGIRGRHNEFNALTSLAVTAAIGIEPALSVLREFRGLPHRCQTIAEIRGVTFIDDSKATNLGAAVAALEGLGDAKRRHIVLIAGGDAKGADLSPLGEVVERFVHHVVVLGRDAERVVGAVAGRVPVTRVGSMLEAVAAARHSAREGDIVLLSPACASLDMFRNYEARGRAFVAAVKGAPS